MTRCYPATVGTEHEHSVNTADLRPLPIVDNNIQGMHGEVVKEFSFEAMNISKELQRHVIEFVPSAPQTSIAAWRMRSTME